MTAPRIVIGAGGTAGHVVPALAVADALRAEGADVAFVGGDRAELELVPAAGYELRTLRVVPLPRGRPLKAARGRRWSRPARSARLGACVKQVRPEPCSAAAATWPGRSAWSAVASRVPLVLTEADSHLGLTNRLLGAVRAAGVPGVSDRGSRRHALPGHRPARSAARHRLARRPGRASGSA